MDKQITKKKYNPPRVVSVSFQVEEGFSGSGGPLVHLELLPSDNNTSNYGAAANSGNSFWGGTTNTESSSGAYSHWDWNW